MIRTKRGAKTWRRSPIRLGYREAWVPSAAIDSAQSGRQTVDSYFLPDEIRCLYIVIKFLLDVIGYLISKKKETSMLLTRFLSITFLCGLFCTVGLSANARMNLNGRTFRCPMDAAEDIFLRNYHLVITDASAKLISRRFEVSSYFGRCLNPSSQRGVVSSDRVECLPRLGKPSPFQIRNLWFSIKTGFGWFDENGSIRQMLCTESKS